MSASIQIVEDDPSVIEVLRFNLERAGYQIHHAKNGEDALGDIRDHCPDLVILDWMLPDMSGIDIARALRRDPATKSLPIIMLTARGAEEDRIRGLDVGADDYVTKPFSIRELESRIKAQLRRANFDFDAEKTYGDIRIDLEKMRVWRGARDIRLSPREFELLKMLISRPGRVYSREAILDHIWGLDDDVELRTVDVVVGRLRRALKRGQETDPIRTVRGAGYAWDEGFASRL